MCRPASMIDNFNLKGGKMKVEHQHAPHTISSKECPRCKLNRMSPELLHTLYKIRNTACVAAKDHPNPSKRDYINACVEIERLARLQFDEAFDWQSLDISWKDLY